MKLATNVWETIGDLTTTAKHLNQAISIAGDFNANITARKIKKFNKLKYMMCDYIDKNALMKADNADKQDTYTSYDLRFNRRLDEWLLGGNEKWIEAINKTPPTTEPTTHLNYESDHIPLQLTCHPHYTCIYNPEYATKTQSTHTKARAELPMTTDDLKKYWNKAKSISTTTNIKDLLTQIKECGQSTCRQTTLRKGTKEAPLDRKLRKIRQTTLGTTTKIQSFITTTRHELAANPKLTLDKLPKARALSHDLQIPLTKLDKAIKTFDEFRADLSKQSQELRKMWRFRGGRRLRVLQPWEAPRTLPAI
jgi:hypothetical protein